MVKHAKEECWKIKNSKEINREHKPIAKKKRRSWKEWKKWKKRRNGRRITVDDRARNVKINDVIWIINAKHVADKVNAYQWKRKKKESLGSDYEISQKYRLLMI